MKKNSATKKLIPAAAMLCISAAMLATSTYAWFTMNTEVSVTGLTTKAKAEDGLVIAAYTSNGTVAPLDSAYKQSDTAYDVTSDSKLLLPTFTNDGTTWYHTSSKEYNNGQAYADEGYKTVTNSSDDNKYYYIANKFNIKATGENKDVYVKSISVTSGGTQAYDDSIRVLIKSGDTVQIFNKSGTTWTTETAAANFSNADDLAQDVTATATVVDASIEKILTATSAGVPVEIFVYYDGEDASCKSANATTFANTVINVTFTSIAPSDWT